MAVLYEICVTVTRELEQRYAADAMGLLRAKGDLATKTGFLVSLVSPQDIDDPAKIARVVAAAVELDIHL